MAIGTVLLQPKKVPTAPAAPDLALLEDTLSLATRVAWDRARGGTIVNDLLAGMEAALQGIAERNKAGIEGALARLEALLAPVIAQVQSLGGGAFADSTAEEILSAGGTLIDLLSKLAQALTVEQVRAHLDEVFDILQSDLGLTGTFLDQMVAALFDDMAGRVRQSPAGAAANIRDNRVQVAQLLRRLKRRLAGLFPFPQLNADALAGPLLARMRQGKYEDFASRAAAVGKALDGGFTVCGTLLDVVPFSHGFNASGPGAAGSGTPQSDRFAWYASWYSGSRVSGDDTKTLDGIACGAVGKDRMEFWAKHSRWAQYALETIFPAALYFREGNYANGTLQMALSLTDGILVPAADIDVPWYLNLPGAVVFVLLGCLEGRNPFGAHDGLLYWLRMLIKGAHKAWWAHATRAIRSLFLSILTLANHRSDDSASPAAGQRLNKDEFVAFSLVCAELLTLLLAALIPHPWYGVNFNLPTFPTGGLISAYLLGTAGMVIVGFLAGWLLSWPIAGERGAIRARTDWLYFLAPFATFPVYWYFLNEGNTDGGKVGYSYPGGAMSIGQIDKLTFPGYPDPSKSPYSLPFEKGTSAECVQGNHGLFSHNAISTTVQLFAYDFSLPYGTEILCMRDGKVVGAPYTADPIDDGTEDDTATQSGANMVTLQHTTKDPQDIDADGSAKITYATYLHGAKGTITAAVRAAATSGAVIPKGTAIMHVDSTGVSRLNHVHVDIRPDNGSGRPNNYTIPFVFSDAGGDGVPTSQHYYESRNTKVG
jgi:hypothetical protein